MFLCTKSYNLAVQVQADTVVNPTMDLLYDVKIYQSSAAAIGAIITIKIIFNVEDTIMEFEPLRISVVMGPVEESMRPLLENPPSQSTYLLSNAES